MTSGLGAVALGALLALTGGCNRREAKSVPPLTAQAPSVPPAQMARLAPPMPNLPPYAEQRPVMLDTSVPPEDEQATAPAPHHARHRAKSETEQTAQEAKPPATTANAADTAQVASTGQPPEMSPIGQLSTGTSDANAADRQVLTNDINSTETTLNGLHRTLSDEEQKTVALIRTFITKARQALKTDDLDGAKNYSTKARLLLDELTKQ